MLSSLLSIARTSGLWLDAISSNYFSKVDNREYEMIDLKIVYFLFGFFCMHQFNYLFGSGDAAIRFFGRENKFRSLTKAENDDFVEPCPTELPIELREESPEKLKERFINSSDQAFGA